MAHAPRVAVKLAYDGSMFLGFQRQPRGRTVEGEIISCLTRLGAIESVKGAQFRSSSRTDRGVSALGNVISFATQFPVESLCSAMNAGTEDVWAYSAVLVSEDFNPRWAKQRWYRYYLRRNAQDIELMSELAKRFEGTHDFSAFSRSRDRNPVRTVDSVEVKDEGAFVVMDLRAESFLWNMVRRMVWMIDAGSRGEIAQASVGPGPNRRPARVGLAPAENLVLMDVDCAVEFSVDVKAAARLREEFQERLDDHLQGQLYAGKMLAILGR